MLIPRGTVRNLAHCAFFGCYVKKGKFRTIRGAYDHRMPVSLLFQVSIVAIFLDNPLPFVKSNTTLENPAPSYRFYLLKTWRFQPSMNLKNPNLPQ